MRVFWPVTVAAAALVGLLAYGLVSKGADTTLDEAVAGAIAPAAPTRRAAVAAHRGPGLARRLQGQGRGAERVGLVVRAVPRGGPAAPEDARADRAAGRARPRRRHAGRRGKALAFLKERDATFLSLRDRDRSYGREFGVTGYPETFIIDRSGRIAAMRRFPVTQKWLDQHLPKLLAEQA